MPPLPQSLTARDSASWLPTRQLFAWLASEETRPVLDDVLYPAQAVDGLVHAEGGSKLRAALQQQPILEKRSSGEHVRCRVGEAVLTAGAFNSLPFDAVVHTVPPFWPREANGESATAHAEWAAKLQSCYRASFRAAFDFAATCQLSDSSAGLAIAMPVLGSGARGAPMAPAARVLAAAAAEALAKPTNAMNAADVASGTGLYLRVVLNPASLASDVDSVAEVVHQETAATAMSCGAAQGSGLPID